MDPGTKTTIWCYTTDPSLAEDYCDPIADAQKWTVTSIKVTAPTADAAHLVNAVVFVDDVECGRMPTTINNSQVVTLACNHELGLIGTSITVRQDYAIVNQKLCLLHIQAFGYNQTALQNHNEPGVVTTVEVSDDGKVYALNASGYIFYKHGAWWKQIPGLATDIAVAADGEVVIISKALTYSSTTSEIRKLQADNTWAVLVATTTAHDIAYESYRGVAKLYTVTGNNVNSC